MTENSMVSTSDPMPAPRVMLTSLTDDTNGDDAAYWVQDLFKVLEEPGLTPSEVFDEAASEGSGSGTKNKEQASARYPSRRSVLEALNVMPAKSRQSESAMIAADPVLDFIVLLQSKL